MDSKSCIFLFLLAATFLSCRQTVVYEVDASAEAVGADGSSARPFPSVHEALEAVRALRSEADRRPVRVEVHGGSYRFEKGILVDETLSDVRIAASKGDRVIFSGGRDIPLRLVRQTEIGGHEVAAVNLREAGISDFGTIKSYGFSRPWSNAWLELFVNGFPMHLSRWPDRDCPLIPMGRVVDSGSVPRSGDFSCRDAVMEYDSARIDSWTAGDDLWIYGCFNVGWAEDALRIRKLDKAAHTLTTDGPTLYGFKGGRPWNRWYAFNVKEETDAPGEYYLDRKSGELYFIAPEKEIRTLSVSLLEEPFFDIRKARNVEISGILFEYSRAAILSLWDTDHVRISGCTFRNSGDVAVIVGKGIEAFAENRHEGLGRPVCGTLGSLQQHLYADQTFNREGGHDNLIVDCTFYNLGAGAVSLGGGNRLTLEPGNNAVSRCRFHDNNRLAKSYRPAIHITGAGNRILNCEIWNTPSMAILLAGNNHLIEGNYIHHACQEVEDQGAFYYGRNPSECGTVVRRNLFAHISNVFSTSSIYVDDGACGLTVEGNIFYEGGRQAVLLGGGSDNSFRGNVFINGRTGVYLDRRLQNWAKAMVAPGGVFERRLREVNYLEEPYRSAYPYMKDYWPNDGTPRRNVFQDNVFIGMGQKARMPEVGVWQHDTVLMDSLEIPGGFSKDRLLDRLEELGVYRLAKDATIGVDRSGCDGCIR